MCDSCVLCCFLLVEHVPYCQCELCELPIFSSYFGSDQVKGRYHVNIGFRFSASLAIRKCEGGIVGKIHVRLKLTSPPSPLVPFFETMQTMFSPGWHEIFAEATILRSNFQTKHICSVSFTQSPEQKPTSAKSPARNIHLSSFQLKNLIAPTWAISCCYTA